MNPTCPELSEMPVYAAVRAPVNDRQEEVSSFCSEWALDNVSVSGWMNDDVQGGGIKTEWRIILSSANAIQSKAANILL